MATIDPKLLAALRKRTWVHSLVTYRGTAVSVVERGGSSVRLIQDYDQFDIMLVAIEDEAAAERLAHDSAVIAIRSEETRSLSGS